MSFFYLLVTYWSSRRVENRMEKQRVFRGKDRKGSARTIKGNCRTKKGKTRNCCRAGGHWKRACAAHHHPSLPSSLGECCPTSLVLSNLTSPTREFSSGVLVGVHWQGIIIVDGLLYRVDFNVPQEKDGSITNTQRIDASLPTIEYALKKGTYKFRVTVQSYKMPYHFFSQELKVWCSWAILAVQMV